jgi:integrase/recombinase XerD
MFYDYLAYRNNQEITNPVHPRRHYISPRRSLPRPASDDEIERLFVAIGSHLRDRTMFTLMLHSGLRVGEVSRLRVSDIDLKKGGTPALRVNGKGEQERIVYLSATGAELLENYLNQRPEGTPEEVFLNRLGQAITITGIQYRLGCHCERAGIWLTCHQLRHTFACRMIAGDVPVVSIQKLLGHASIRTTQRYVRVADKKVENDYQAAVGRLTNGSGLPEEGER